jgi:hypothetical protein
MRPLLQRRVLAVALVAAFTPAAASAANRTVLISRPDGRGPAPPALDNDSDAGAVSPDGRYVAFTSPADGFAAGLDPMVTNVFLRDTRTNTTTLVSRSDSLNGAGADQDSVDPAIAVTSAGHVLVAFDTEATNMVDHATGMPVPAHVNQVWLRDVTAGTTTLISRAGASGPAADGEASQPSLDNTAGGPVVAFASNAANLVDGGGGLFLRTVDAGTTERVSCHNRDCSIPQAAGGTQPSVRVVPPVAGTLCAPPAQTSPCVLIAFASQDGSVTDNPANPDQVVVAVASAPQSHGSAAGRVAQFVDATSGNGFTDSPSINTDGRAVAVISDATNLTADPVPADTQEAYVVHLDTGTTQLVSRGSAAANQDVESVALGGDQSHLRAIFESAATNLGNPLPLDQVYVRDLSAATTSLIGRASGPNGVPANFGASGPVAISADGSAAIFESNATNLGDDPSGGNFDRVHLRRIASPGQQLELVSRPSGTGAFATGVAPSESGPNDVSADGRFVAFESDSATLPGGRPGNPVTRVFVRDVLTGRTIVASRASGSNGAEADGEAFAPTISADGRWVLFESDASNLTPDSTSGIFQVYVRDLATNTTTLVSRMSGAGGRPGPVDSFPFGISADGRSALIESSGSLTPSGTGGVFHLYVRDLVANTTTLVDRDSGAAGAVASSDAQQAAIDADGHRVAWVTTAKLADAPNDGKRHVYLRDLRTNATTLISRADGAAGASAAADSLDPSIDAAGDSVAFSSTSQNLGATFSTHEVFVRAGTHTSVVSQAPGGGVLLDQADRPTLDAAGDRVSFIAEGPAPSFNPEAYVRDISTHTTTLASVGDGPSGAPANGRVEAEGISPSGNCVAFTVAASNLGDGFSSSDFLAVHMRSLRGDCPPATAAPPPALALGSLKLVPARFHVGGRGGGTTIRFTLSRAGRVTLRFARLSGGRRAGGRCVHRGRGKRCTISTRVGTLMIAGRAGANRLRFRGRVRGAALKVGRYRVTATPVGGTARTVGFTIVPAPRHRR